MKKVFDDCRILDKKARERFGISEEIMMENAAAALENEIRAHEGLKKVVILCGVGNNSADGMALARRIVASYEVTVIKSKMLRTKIGRAQEKMAKACGVTFISLAKVGKSSVIEEADCIVDCIFGAGFHGEVPSEYKAIINKANAANALKIACDIPTGIDCTGKRGKIVFSADVTVTMGSYKSALFSEDASDLTGVIKCASLGFDSTLYEYKTLADGFMLEESDLVLPLREKKNVHKGIFGHTAIFAGEKKGAAVIAATAATAFGSGLVTLVSAKEIEGAPFDLMQSSSLPEKANAIAAGMGLGKNEAKAKEVCDYLRANKSLKAVFDADLMGSKELISLLNELEADEKEKGKRIILTPHPKEFFDLLKVADLAKSNATFDTLLNNRVDFVKSFCEKYKKVVLVLKGSIPIIATFGEKSIEIYYNPHGKNCLAKGGSGDVLSGLTSSLLSQGYGTLQAALSASLAHALSSKRIKSSYGMTPFMLIEEVRNLG